MMRITETVKQLIIINIIFFVGSIIIGDGAYDILALHSPQDDKFGIWQLFSYIFMHSDTDYGHIIFNMLGLWMFGSALEEIWGAKKFIFFYISCGVGAALLHLTINYFQVQHMLEGAADLNLSSDAIHKVLNFKFDDGSAYRGELLQKQLMPLLQKAGTLEHLNEANFKAIFDAAIESKSITVGASGAIYGLLVAFAFMFPNLEMMMLFVPIPIKAKYFVPGVLVFDMVMGIRGQAVIGQGDGVAHFAHLGGALIGFIMMWYWKKNQYNNRRWN